MITHGIIAKAEHPKAKIANVTARDIKYGIPSDTCACPVARAVKRLFPGCMVQVGKESVTVVKLIQNSENWRQIRVFDHDAVAFIRKFDSMDPENLPEPCKVKLIPVASVTPMEENGSLRV